MYIDRARLQSVSPRRAFSWSPRHFTVQGIARMVLATRLLTKRCISCGLTSNILRWRLRECATVDSWFGSCPCLWYFGICTLLVFPTYVCVPSTLSQVSTYLRPQWVAVDMTAHIQCTSLRLCLYHFVAASVCLGILYSEIMLWD